MSEQVTRSKGVSEEACNSAPSILRLATVKGRVGLCRSAIYARQSEGTFPKSISLGPRAVGWISSEIDAWIASRIEASRGRA